MLGDQVLAGLFGRVETRPAVDALGAGRIEKVRPARHLAVEPAPAEHVDQLDEPAVVFLASAARDLVVVQGCGGRFLHGDELAGVAVVLDVGKRAHQTLVPAHPAHAPADHVPALREGMDLDAHLPRAGHLEKARRTVLVVEHGVGGVLHHHEPVRPGELDHLLVELPRGHLARGAVRIVDHQELRATPDLLRDRRQVGQKIVLGQQRQTVHLAAVVLRVRTRHRIARHGHQRHVARVHDRGGQHGQRRLRADRVVDLRRRVELDVELPGHESGDRLLELGDAVVGVAPVLRLVDLGGHHPADRLGGHLVVFADAEIDQLSLGMLGQRLTLRPLDLLELVDLRALAILGTADPIGKKRLEIGVAHHLLEGTKARIRETDRVSHSEHGEKGGPDIVPLRQTRRFQ